jgi:hypothetical protein
MTCTQSQILLDAYADAELGHITAFRVRRHLAGCPACAAQLDAVQRLNASVHAWRDIPAPAALEGRIVSVLPQTASAPPPRDRRVARRAAVGLAGIAAAIGTGFWLLPGQPGRPAVAFAEVEQAMQNVQTVSWRTTVQGDKKSGDKLMPGALTFTTWLRRNPAASATTNYANTSSMPITMDDTFPIRTLQDKRGIFCLTRKDCVVTPAHSSVDQRVTRQIESLTQLPKDISVSCSLPGQLPTTVTNFHQENVIVDGQNQIRFDRDLKTTWPEGFGKNIYRLVHVIDWVNMDTHRLVRVEMHLTEDTTGIKPFTTLVKDQFQYNTSSPPGVFDWSPPQGAKVEHQK